jgi:hypothetical protein
MSDPDSPGEPPRPSIWRRTLFGSSNRRWGWKSTLGLVLIVAFVDLIGGGSLIYLLGLVAFGWIGFLRRVCEGWRWSSTGILSFVLLVGGFVVGSHLFLRRLRAATRPQSMPWPWRWTLRLATLVVVIFLAGIATVGVVHQSAWLYRDGITRTSSPYRGYSAIHQLDREMANRAVTSAEARTLIQAQLPTWRVVVLQRGQEVGALVLADEQSTTVVMAIRDQAKGQRFSVMSPRKTTVAEQVSLATAMLNLPRPESP